MKGVILPAPDPHRYDSGNEAQTRRLLQQQFRDIQAQLDALTTTVEALEPPVVATHTAAEALSAGDFVSFNADGEVVLADASTNDLLAVGFVDEDYADGATDVVVVTVGNNTSLSGLTEGEQYYLSDTTPGGVVITPPVGFSPMVVQQVGIAYSATAMRVSIQQACERPEAP